MRVGFIGLGSQGGPMADMILASGHELHLWARRPSVLEPYVKRGAIAEDDPRRLGATVELVGVCVINDDDVREVVYTKGLLDGLKPGSILAIHSTVRPQTCQDIAADAKKKDVHVVDAPVSGSGEAALARKLLVMVGGDTNAIARARPVFESYGNPVVALGPVGSGQLAKLVNNILCIANMEMARAALDFGESLGMSRERLREILLSGSGRSFSLDALGRLVTPQSAGQVHMLFAKDAALAAEAARASGADLSTLVAAADRFLAYLKKIEVNAVKS